MTAKEWLQKAKNHQEELQDFVSEWHPSSYNSKREDLPITAPSAEAGCALVRELIRKEDDPSVGPSPEERWKLAIQEENPDELYSLLNSAWFGVPESTGCWSIPGFQIAVSLLEDPWEEEPEDQQELDKYKDLK